MKDIQVSERREVMDSACKEMGMCWNLSKRSVSLDMKHHRKEETRTGMDSSMIREGGYLDCRSLTKVKSPG
jgi:hypothetical protein